MTPDPARRFRRRLALLLIAAVASIPVPPAPAAEDIRFLHVENGEFVRDGRPYRGIGVNYFDAFSRSLADGASADGHLAGFRMLREFGIPFVRFHCGGFYPVNWKRYRDDPDEWFRRLDRFVADAEAHGIGLVPSLFWSWFTVPAMTGEPASAWGDPASGTHRFAKQYIHEVVTRYRNSPAILAWEFGNEYNLVADLPGGPANHARCYRESLGMPAKPREGDFLTSADIATALRAFATAVRAVDPHRPIVSGHAMPRSAAARLEREGTWTPDSRSEWLASLAKLHPDPVDTLGIHYYPFHAGEGTGISGIPAEESLRACLDLGRRTGKPLFVGEFGPNGSADPQVRFDQTQTVLDRIVANRVPLSAVWVFDYPRQEMSIPADDTGRAVLSLVRDANLRLREQAMVSRSYPLCVRTPDTAEKIDETIQ